MKATKPTSKAIKTGRKVGKITQSSKVPGNQLSGFAASGFPAEIKVRMRYSDLIALTTGALAPNGADGNYGTEYSLRTNSVFDPDYAFGGHQPYYFDTYASLYGNYRVEGLRYSIVFTSPGSGATDVICAVSYGISTTASLTSKTPARPIEWPNAQTGTLSVTGQRSRCFTGYIDNATLFGVSRTRYVGSDDYQAIMTTNPAVLGLLNVAVASTAAYANQGVSVLLTVDYDVVFYNRLNIAQS